MTTIGTSGYSNFVRSIHGSGRNKAQNKTETCSFINITIDESMLKAVSATQDASKTDENGVPGRWTDESLYAVDLSTLEGYSVNRDALSKVREQLRLEGIDADKRTPTHEITDEKIEWLSSRYSFDFLSVCSFEHSEYGNFMLDLAYLNVFSLDEVENMFGVMPFNANHKAFVYKIDTDDGISGYVNPFGGAGNYVDSNDMNSRLITEYLREKYMGKSESEYIKMAENYFAQTRERLELINDIFVRFSQNTENALDDTLLKIEDASEKLKEDFGGLR